MLVCSLWSLVIQSAAWPMGRYCPLVAHVGLLTSVHTKQELPPRHAQSLCFLGDARVYEVGSVNPDSYK